MEERFRRAGTDRSPPPARSPLAFPERVSRPALVAAASALAVAATLLVAFPAARRDGAVGPPPSSPVDASPAWADFTPAFEPLEGPVRIGLQPGHWKIGELPDELARLRTSTGAAWGRLRELDLNLAVVRDLAARLEKRGFAVDLVPATVPPGYRADLFISVHADRSDLPLRSGWKLAPPWRASPWSVALAGALTRAFAASGLPRDSGGVTDNMRGYFGFSWRRYEHALSPYTPAVLVELGFLGNAADRERLRDRPGFYAEILEQGIDAYLETYDRGIRSAFVPTNPPRLVAGPSGARLRSSPDRVSAILDELVPGQPVTVLSRRGDWYEAWFPEARMSAWLPASELAGAPGPAPDWTFVIRMNERAAASVDGGSIKAPAPPRVRP
ncbi:MAG TPA: N-acetylmuramoyl-L-alanine amidase [Spirochaetales bacterium]|nr:N-acetylmuramoyl-L-alanine amidase [Spirochaetales bacterium]